MTTTIEFTNTTCRCGCGTVLGGKKSRFAQGHDARFVSAMKQIALDSDKGLHAEVTLVDKSTDPATQSRETVKNAVETLGSTPLMEKLISGFKKEQGRMEERAARTAKAEQAKLDRAAAKARTPKEGKPARGKAKSPATQKAEAAAEGAIDLDTLAPTSDVADLDAIVAPVAAVEGEAPVARPNGGRTRRGNLNSQA